MRNYIRMVVLPALCIFAIICTGFVCSAEQVNRYEYIEIQPTLKAEPIDPIVIISEQPLEETVSAVEIEVYFPDTVYGVVYQANQFSSMWNGRVDKCFVDDDICQLVEEELQSRTNVDTIFFTAGEYGKYGRPMFQVGNHYFSSYE